MKKITTSMIYAFVLTLTMSASAFAKMSVDSFRPITESSFTGKIIRVSYANLSIYSPNERPHMTVDISYDKDKNNPIEMTFDDADLVFGSSLINAIGKNVYVLFSPENKLATQFIINH